MVKCVDHMMNSVVSEPSESLCREGLLFYYVLSFTYVISQVFLHKFWYLKYVHLSLRMFTCMSGRGSGPEAESEKNDNYVPVLKMFLAP